METINMRKFITKNSKFKIISGEILSNRGNTCYTLKDFKGSVGTKYVFSDGSVMVLSTEDIESSDYSPIWEDL